jgi:hypothetical protein
MAGSFEYGDEISVCINWGKFLDWLRKYELVKNNSAERVSN